MRGVTLRFEAEEPSLVHPFDVEKLETAVLNLLSNAVKFVDEGGTVVVRVAAVDGAAVLTVTNTGQGIPAEALPHLFNRFYQVDGSATRTREGSGIGLALVHEIVKLHGGRVTVESSPEAGTSFAVTLPVVVTSDNKPPVLASGDGRGAPGEVVVTPEPPPAAVPRMEQQPEANGTRPVVLLVEDNADMRAYLRDHLADAYQVEEAPDGEAGVAAAQALVPDLVLSDVMMPRMDGMALVAALKADVQTSHIPVVLLTAKGEVDSKIEGLATGADDYLTKPFNAAELLARVENLIAQRRLLRARYQEQLQEAPPAAVPGLPAPDVTFLEQVQTTVQAHLADATFGVEALAEAVHMSPRQLTRKLKGLLGETPNQLIVRLRLAQAAALLQQPGARVGEVAAQVGFRSTSRFREAFRARYNMAPSQYATAPDAREA